MAKHRAMVTAESNDGRVTVVIKCDTCEGGTFTLARAHVETLARVLPQLCAKVGIDLGRGITEEVFVCDVADAASKAAAEALYQDWLARRKAAADSAVPPADPTTH